MSARCLSDVLVGGPDFLFHILISHSFKAQFSKTLNLNRGPNVHLKNSNSKARNNVSEESDHKFKMTFSTT